MQGNNRTPLEGTKEHGWVKVSRKLFEALVTGSEPFGKAVVIEDWGHPDKDGFYLPKMTGLFPYTTVVNIKDCPPDWIYHPEYAYIGRPGKGLEGPWGNPFTNGTREERIDRYRKLFADTIKHADGRIQLEPLRGKKLVCFCTPLACHGDVIAEYLNGD